MWEKMGARICMIESLCCSLITPLLIGHTPIQNKSLNFEKKKKNVYIDSGIYTKDCLSQKVVEL